MTSMLKRLRMPTYQDVQPYVEDREVLACCLGFLGLSFLNVLIMVKLFREVMPNPIFMSWWQLAQGLVMAYILGEAGLDFPKLAYFPRVRLDRELMGPLAAPALCYVAMLTAGNYVFYHLPTPAMYPVAISLAVVMHHLVRHVGCAEGYSRARWQSVGLLAAAFLLGSADTKGVGRAMPFALAFALLSALFRAGYLQQVLHLGSGNALQVHQSLWAIIVLPLLGLVAGEAKVLLELPLNPFSWRFFNTYGSLLLAGALPFFKNVVSNRLIRKTGQKPWRTLELVSVALIFVFGLAAGRPGFLGFVATLLVLAGRGLGSVDVIIAEEEAEAPDAAFAGSQAHSFQQAPSRGTSGAQRQSSKSASKSASRGSKALSGSVSRDADAYQQA